DDSRVGGGAKRRNDGGKNHRIILACRTLHCGKDSRRVHWQRRPVSATIGLFACGLGSSTAMRATHRIIGCTLCLAFAGSAAAASLDCQSVDSGGSTAVSQSANSGSGGIGADVLGMNRDNSS